MKWHGLIAGASLALVVNTSAEDKVSAEFQGSVEVEGISDAGVIVGASVPSYARHLLDGKISVVTKEGEVHRVETYTEWSAANGVRGQVWERLYVSGGTFTGWTERFIQTPANIVFSRNVIDGDIEQEIKSDGSGYVEWTVTGGDNEIASDDTSDDGEDSVTDTTSGDDLPTVEILEEGEFDGISDRRIDIDQGNDDPKLTFRDNGYENVSFTDSTGTHEEVVNQKLKLEGRGKGSLAFDPNQKHEASASSTPTPVPNSTPVPTPTPDSTDAFTNDNVDSF